MNRKIIAGIIVVSTMAIVMVLSDWLQSNKRVDFSTQIKPIFNSKCIACHGGVKQNGGFSLLFQEDALARTKSGKLAIVPGDAANSELIKRIKEKDPELRMPYEKPKLSEEEIDLLTRWIDQGAEWGEHWAYSLPEKVEIPSVTSEGGFSANNTSAFVQNTIDHFILARLESEELHPNPPAERNVIARRLALDLTGLPPDQKLFEAFTQGQISYESFVDTLLARPAYGEKWASWWLDLARYADTKGYEADKGRTIWQYRDWVIKAFNQDMPYDQFTVEQLAGDLLPDPSVDQLIATAFHRNTLNNDEGGTEDEEFRVASVIDRTNTTFEVWQSTTMGCVQCHSHPYDPIRFEEYFKLLAFFNNTRDEDIGTEDPNLRFYNKEQQERANKVNHWVLTYGSEDLAKKYKNFMSYMEPKYQAHNCTKAVLGNRLALWDDGVSTLKNVNTQGAGYMYMNYSADYDGTTMTIRKDDAKGEILARFIIDKTNSTIRRFPFKIVDETIDLYFEADNNQIPKQTSTSFISWFAFIEDLPGPDASGYEAINATFLDLLNTPTPELPIMVENADYMARTTRVFERGNWLTKGDTVQPGTPQVLNAWNSDWPDNRYGLSQWLVSKENPLTARTLVNRVWDQLFGRGIVTTVEDMGTQSEPPTHPGLLDWLALRFMNENQWSVKALVKDIVMSGTYRQSSENSPELYQKDPENELYARGPRFRLSAEQIRDQALAVSGLLSPKMYGPGVMPPQPEGVWQSVYSSEKWTESKGEDKFRRAVYTYLKRTSPYPSFIFFDAGSREVSTINRTITNTPLQALVTLNDPVYLEAAYHLAKSMGGPEVIDGISRGYEKACYSKISPDKLEALIDLYDTSLSEFKGVKEKAQNYFGVGEEMTPEMAALTVVANAIMNLDEFLSKS